MRRRALRSAASTVCPSTPGAPLLRTTFSSARARLARDATSSSSPHGAGAPARVAASSWTSPYAAERRAPRMRPTRLPPRPLAGCRRMRSSIDAEPSFSIHLSLCSAGFRQPHALLRRDPTSAGPSAGRRRLLPAYRRRAGPRRPPRVRPLDVPPPPAPIPLRPRLDFGRRVPWHANPAGPACSGLHFRSMLRLAERLPPHTASRRRAWTSEAASLPCSCLRLPVATNSLRRGLAPPIQ